MHGFASTAKRSPSTYRIFFCESLRPTASDKPCTARGYFRRYRQARASNPLTTLVSIRGFVTLKVETQPHHIMGRVGVPQFGCIDVFTLLQYGPARSTPHFAVHKMLQPLAETCGAIVDRKRPDPACATVKHDGELKLGIPDAQFWYLRAQRTSVSTSRSERQLQTETSQVHKPRPRPAFFLLGLGECYGKIACPPHTQTPDGRRGRRTLATKELQRCRWQHCIDPLHIWSQADVQMLVADRQTLVQR